MTRIRGSLTMCPLGRRNRHWQPQILCHILPSSFSCLWGSRWAIRWCCHLPRMVFSFVGASYGGRYQTPLKSRASPYQFGIFYQTFQWDHAPLLPAESRKNNLIWSHGWGMPESYFFRGGLRYVCKWCVSEICKRHKSRILACSSQVGGHNFVLKTGAMLTLNQSLGSFPLSIEHWKIAHIDGASWWHRSST